MSYLVFPRVRVQAANMLSASFLMGGPPVFAAYTGVAIDLGHRVFPHPAKIPLHSAWLGLV